MAESSPVHRLDLDAPRRPKRHATDTVELSAQSEADLARFHDAGVIAMARWLRGEGRMPRGCGKEHWSAQRLIELAACVDGFDRHALDEQLDGEQWGWAMRNRIAAGSAAAVAAQDLFDTLFYLYRADRHAGGGTIERDPVAHRIAVELRQRVRAGRVAFRRSRPAGSPDSR